MVGRPVDADLGQVLARHVVDATFERLPQDAVRAAKQSTLDILGVALGASGMMTALPQVVALTNEWGGAPEASVIGFGDRLPAVSAAFLNGAMAHGLDFDDHLPEGHHPSSCIVPSLFALAQRGGGATGCDFLTALAVGQDLFARLRKSIAWKQDWFLTPVFGVFAATAACAKLLGLPERQVIDALGIAGLQSAGTMQVAFGTGGDLRGMYAGFAARAAVFSALLAEAGVTGTTRPFEGKAGFFEVYFDGEWDRTSVLAGLGEDFHGGTIIYKLWPSCGASHPYIDTTLRLLGRPGRGDEIERIEVVGGDFAQGLSEPLAERRHPASVQDAKFNIPYPVAVAVARGTVGVGDFSEERRNDPAVRSVADKIEFVEDHTLNWGAKVPGAAVRITLTDGSVLEGATSHSTTAGSSDKPLGWEDLIAKFEDCAGYAVRTPDSADRGRVIDAVRALEDLSDVSTVIELLA